MADKPQRSQTNAAQRTLGPVGQRALLERPQGEEKDAADNLASGD